MPGQQRVPRGRGGDIAVELRIRPVSPVGCATGGGRGRRHKSKVSGAWWVEVENRHSPTMTGGCDNYFCLAFGETRWHGAPSRATGRSVPPLRPLLRRSGLPSARPVGTEHFLVHLVAPSSAPPAPPSLRPAFGETRWHNARPDRTVISTHSVCGACGAKGGLRWHGALSRGSGRRWRVPRAPLEWFRSLWHSVTL